MQIQGATRHAALDVSTLVLMDSWINAKADAYDEMVDRGFNPCFNGFMDKCSNMITLLYVR